MISLLPGSSRELDCRYEMAFVFRPKRHSTMNGNAEISGEPRQARAWVADRKQVRARMACLSHVSHRSNPPPTLPRGGPVG